MKDIPYPLQHLDERLDRIERATLAQKKVLTFKEACLYTGFAESYMYKLTSAGIIPYSKPNGKTLFFDRERLDEWLLSNASLSSQEKERLAATHVSASRN
jgi:excisionase family DNA binding protein